MVASDGRHVIYNVTLTLHVFASIFFFVSFVTPYWFQSWPRVYSPFKRIGLWETCFAGLVLPMDIKQKAYHGCWWSLATEFKKIRSWLMPDWFITCQVITTFVLIGLIINMIMLIFLWVVINGQNKTRSGYRRPPMSILQVSTYMTLALAGLMIIVVVLFGVMVHRDRNWMPNPDLNYLSWSYGLAVVCAFFCIFQSIAQVTYLRLEMQELRMPPTPAGMSMLHHPQYPPPHQPQFEMQQYGADKPQYSGSPQQQYAASPQQQYGTGPQQQYGASPRQQYNPQPHGYPAQQRDVYPSQPQGGYNAAGDDQSSRPPPQEYDPHPGRRQQQDSSF